jgi:Spy/CpxP family protein refolding chaperone
MRKITLILLTLISLLAIWSTQPALAQDTGKGERPGVLAQRRVQRWDAMAKWLQLTDEQKAKIKSIVENARKQAQTIRTDSSLTPVEKRQKLRELRQSARQEIGSVLTPEQREKWMKWRCWSWHRWQMWRAYRAGKIGKDNQISPYHPRQFRARPEMAKPGWWWNRWGKPF